MGFPKKDNALKSLHGMTASFSASVASLVDVNEPAQVVAVLFPRLEPREPGRSWPSVPQQVTECMTVKCRLYVEPSGRNTVVCMTVELYLKPYRQKWCV